MPKYIKGDNGKFAGSIGDGKNNVPTPSLSPVDLHIANLKSEMVTAMNHPRLALIGGTLGSFLDASKAAIAARRAYLSARLEKDAQITNARIAKQGLSPITDEEKTEVLDNAERLYQVQTQTTPAAVDTAYLRARAATLAGTSGRLKERGLRGLLNKIGMTNAEAQIAAAKQEELDNQQNRGQ